MSKPLSDIQRVFLLVVWLIAFGIVIVQGLDPSARVMTGGLVQVWRLFIPLLVGALISLIVHVSNQIK